MTAPFEAPSGQAKPTRTRPIPRARWSVVHGGVGFRRCHSVTNRCHLVGQTAVIEVRTRTRCSLPIVHSAACRKARPCSAPSKASRSAPPTSATCFPAWPDEQSSHPTSGCNAHALRHTHAYELLAEGVRLDVISGQLGHSSLATTHRYLNHIAPHERVEKVRQRNGWTRL